MKATQQILSVVAAAAMVSVASAASASSITPQFTTFGSLPAATFGGSGIPNDAVAIETLTPTAGVTITLGLTATPRFTVGDLANNGAGTFFAPEGTSSGRALWNVDFYASVTGDSTSNYDFKLLYDFDPGVGTDSAQLGVWDLSAQPLDSGTGPIQNSENLTFAFLAGTPALTGITAPTFEPFNPFASGQYSFELEAFNTAGAQLGDAAINVDTTPEPGTMLLLGTGLALTAGGLRRRLRHARR